jgi:hypothetical protein
MGLCGAEVLHGQTTDCAVTGYLVNADGSAAAHARVNAVSVVKGGSSVVLTPILLSTDAIGFTSFSAPRLSSVWIVASALGIAASGDVAILIPDAEWATLGDLAQSARPPVSGISVTSGPTPVLSLSLQDFEISLSGVASPASALVDSLDGRGGAAALTSRDITTASSPASRNTVNPLSGIQASSGDLRLGSLTFEKPDNTVATTPITFETSESGAGNFYIGMGSSPNSFVGRQNQVFTWGYNQLPGASNRVLETEHALAYRIENYWAPNGNTTATESHLVYINRAGVSKRVQSLYIDLNTDDISHDVTSDYSSWTTSAGAVNFLLTPGLARLMDRTQLWSTTNNYPFFQQKLSGVSNAYGILIYINSANRVMLGGQGTVGLQVDGASVAPAITGARFLCISTAGVITSSATPCSGT